MSNSTTEPDPYQEPVECIRAARARVAQVMQSLQSVSSDNGEGYRDLLDEALRQLQAATALLRDFDAPADTRLRFEIEELRRQLQTLSLALAESERFVSAWIGRLGTRGGYNEQGATAPLILIKKVNITG